MDEAFVPTDLKEVDDSGGFHRLENFLRQATIVHPD